MKTTIISKLSDGTSVLGEYNDPTTVTDDSDDDTDVFAYQKSSYFVIIPKTMTMDGEFEYSVAVLGNLAYRDYVVIQPENNFLMTTSNKESILTTIIQPINTFTYTSGVNKQNWLKTAGTITMEDISAGKWTGTFTFVISSNADIEIPDSIASIPQDIGNGVMIGNDLKQKQKTIYKTIEK